MQIILQDLWVRHIERFSERMRGRLYAALIAYLTKGTEIPEKLLPHLGIILDLIEQEGITPAPADTPAAADPKELEYLQEFMNDSAPGFSRRYKISPDDLERIINSQFAYWQEPTPHGGQPLRHKDADHFWHRMSWALKLQLQLLGYEEKSA